MGYISFWKRNIRSLYISIKVQRISYSYPDAVVKDMDEGKIISEVHF